jgi:putative transposase
VDRPHGFAVARSAGGVSPWNSIFRRFNHWSHKGIWWRIFDALSNDSDFEYLIVASTIVRAHQHAAGTRRG